MEHVTDFIDPNIVHFPVVSRNMTLGSVTSALLP
jgi:hypothetical protein